MNDRLRRHDLRNTHRSTAIPRRRRRTLRPAPTARPGANPVGPQAAPPPFGAHRAFRLPTVQLRLGPLRGGGSTGAEAPGGEASRGEQPSIPGRAPCDGLGLRLGRLRADAAQRRAVVSGPVGPAAASAQLSAGLAATQAGGATVQSTSVATSIGRASIGRAGPGTVPVAGLVGPEAAEAAVAGALIGRAGSEAVPAPTGSAAQENASAPAFVGRAAAEAALARASIGRAEPGTMPGSVPTGLAVPGAVPATSPTGSAAARAGADGVRTGTVDLRKPPAGRVPDGRRRLGERPSSPGAAAAAARPADRAGERAALLDAVRLRLAEAGAAPTSGSVAAAVRASGPPLGGSDVLDAVRLLRAELVGAGPLDPLLAEPEVTDVLVNAPDEVWVDRGSGLQRVPQVRFPDAEAVRRLAHRLATSVGRRLDDARPWVDARLPDGTRLHAVLPPIADGCTHISLRTSRARPFTLTELVAAGALPPVGAEILRAVLRARLSLLISGGTGTGKTTLLAALLGLVPPDERIVLAEDSAELRPDHPHVVRLQSRPPNQEGVGELTLRDLVRQALRMRPDRLVVGEVRGAEVVDLLAALNTGHEGGSGTVHANTAEDVPARLEALGSLAGLDRVALHSQLRAALDVVVHLVRDPASGLRRVAALHLLTDDGHGLARTTPAVAFTTVGGCETGPGWDRLRGRCADRGVKLPGRPR